MNRVKLNIDEEFGTNVIAFDFPALKDWDISAHQHFNAWIWPSDSEVSIHIKDFDIDFKTSLRLDDNGYLDPVIYNVDINFGSTDVFHSNNIIRLLMH
jgi:hypothetical protein